MQYQWQQTADSSS